MKIAIHHTAGTFSERWIEYCINNDISYKLVNCYSSDIIDQLNDCQGLMWNWTLTDYKADLFARQLTISLEKKGLKVYPDINTGWYYDDKLGQKYLFEAIKAPFVKSFVFFSKEEAFAWISKTTFPKVFKLRGGAGSSNVKLIQNKKSAKRIVKRAFGRGFPLYTKLLDLKQRIWVLKRDKDVNALISLSKGIVKFFLPKGEMALLPRQKGYAYFQEFVPNNQFDDRIIIIGERALAIRRFNRKNDFRASGSGIIEYDPKLFNIKIIEIAFKVSQNIDSQSTAFDFIYDQQGNPLIVEISYAFAAGPVYDACPGYWDKQLNWTETKINPQFFIIEDFINSLVQEK